MFIRVRLVRRRDAAHLMGEWSVTLFCKPVLKSPRSVKWRMSYDTRYGSYQVYGARAAEEHWHNRPVLDSGEWLLGCETGTRWWYTRLLCALFDHSPRLYAYLPHFGGK